MREPGADVRFSAEHRFTASPAAVAAVLEDPGFYRALELPDLRLLEVEGDEAGDGVLLRYEFTGNLDPVALRLLGGERLTWSQQVHLRGHSGGSLQFAAEANPGLLHGRADFVLHPSGGRGHARAESTTRRLEGELTVAVPVVGRMAERRIVPGILARLDVEAGEIRRRLTGA